MTEKQMTECLNPKILGAWNLHQATMYMNLDFFILHSSITAILGAPGQCNYGTGNAFQDSLIAVRRKSNLPIQSLNWGPLDMGMLASGEERDRKRKNIFDMGFEFIDKKEIGVCLETAILSGKHQVMIAKLDLEKVNEFLESNLDTFTKYRLHHILPKDNTKLKDSPLSLSFDLQSLKDATPDEMSRIIEGYINKLVEKILIVTAEMISPSTKFIDVGMDSMQAMTLVIQVKEDLDVRVPLNLLFGPDTTIYTLCKLVEDKYKGNEIDYLASENPVDVPNDGKITYPELRYLHLNNLVIYKACHHASDLNFDNLHLTRDDVINFIKTMVMRYPICTAIFDWKEGTKPERADVTKSFVDMETGVDICEVDPNDPDIEKIFTERYFEKFDTRSKGPVRFTFAVRTNSIRLSIVFHHVGFDLMAVNLFVLDIVEWVKSAKKNIPIENSQTPIKQHHSVCHVLDDILSKNITDFQKFWRQKIENGVPTITLNNGDFKLRDGPALVSERKLKSERRQWYESFSQSLGATPFHLYMTIYQLLLGTISKTARVVVNTTVNLRPYSSELMKRVECISNQVPMFADIPSSDTTFKDFLQGNSDEILQTLDHAMYPYTEIVKLIPEDQNKELDRHELAYQDFTFVKDLSEVADTANLGLKVAVEKTYTATETTMKVLAEDKTITFRLMLGGENYHQLDADDFLEDFMRMLDCVVETPDISIQNLQNHIKGLNVQQTNKRGFDTT